MTANLITSVIMLIAIVALATVSIILMLKLAEANKTIALQDDNNLLLLDEVVKANEREQQAKLENTDGFVKFLSDSREWAFNYIEDVQTSIQGLHDAMSKNDKAKILEHYNELQKFLPLEEKQQGENNE